MTLTLVLSSAVALLLTIHHVSGAALIDGCQYSDGTVVLDKQFIWVDRYQICQCEVNNDNKFQCANLAPNIPEVKDAAKFKQCDNCPKVITIEKAKREVTRAMRKLTRLEDDSDMAPYQANITSMIASLKVTKNDYKRQIREQRRLKETESEVDPCVPNPCQYGGNCTATGSEFSCDCSPGFTGETCETEPNPCTLSPCLNDGLCTATGSEFSCDCSLGFTGDFCETQPNPCVPNPCQNGGNCTAAGSQFSCDCSTGFTGEMCQTEANPCVPNPCQNGGNCTATGSHFSCECRPGFTGETCEIKQTEVDPCLSNPCQNGGLCTAAGSEFSCDCSPGFTGETCETEPNPCVPNPCQNDGSCTAAGSKFSCDCNSGFTGETCETELAASTCLTQTRFPNPRCVNALQCSTDLVNLSSALSCPPGSICCADRLPKRIRTKGYYPHTIRPASKRRH